MKMDEFLKRRVVVTVENGPIVDGLFAPIVAATLRELADLIEAGKAGRNAHEIYLRADGTLAIMSSEDVRGVCIPYRETDSQCLLAGYVPDSA